MSKIIRLTHVVHDSTCYINGLFDILANNGAKYDYYLLCMLGGMASFAYLRFKALHPPYMVYWGNNTKYLLNQLEEIIGFKQIISEGRAYNHEFPKIKQFLDNGQPVIVGALDMYYLNYLPDIYHKQRIPIHYVLVVGYDDEKQMIYVQDCGLSDVQQIPYQEFKDSMNVSVPGMSKKNTYRIITLPRKLPSELETAEKGFTYVADRLLNPPVSMIGIPAMRKLARDIITWDNDECFNHMVAYAGLTPPLIASDLSHNDGLRFEKARVLRDMGKKYQKRKWGDAAHLFMNSGELIIQLCDKALKHDVLSCSELLTRIADTEEKAYELLI
jgi:hypothetical protein